MATAQIQINKLQTDVSSICELCLNEYNKTDRIPTEYHDTGDARKHTACAVCRAKWPDPCPFCNKRTSASGTEDTASPSYDSITDLKQVYSMSKCTECDDEAICRCTDCRIYLCRDCKTVHIKKKSSKKHDVQDLANLSPTELKNFQEASRCDDHGYVQDMYCTQCEEACCLGCEEHKEHKVEKLDKTLLVNAKKCEPAARFVLKQRAEIEKQVTGLEKSLEEAKSKTTCQINIIKDTVNDITVKIRKQGKDLENSVQQHLYELSKSLEEEIRKRKDILEALQPIEQFTKGKKPMRTIETLKLQKTILKCEYNVKELCHPGNDLAKEAAIFVQNSDLDFERLKIGYVQGTALEDDKTSQKGSAVFPLQEKDIRMLIIGNRKSGRTKTAFALMEKEVEPASRRFMRTWQSKSFSLRRSPGMDVDGEREKIKTISGPGPHIVLCVKNPDEDVSIIDDYSDVFNGDMMKHMIVIFTGKKDLVKKNITLEKYVQTVSAEPLKRILNSVGKHRVLVNTDDRDNLDAFREEVFKMAIDIVRSNGLRYLPLR